MSPFYPPLAACEMAFVAMAAVAFVSWVLKQIAAANQPPRPKPGGPRPVRPRNERVQQEIDQFIQEATGRRPERKDVLAADDIEVVEQGPARRPAPRRQAPAARRPEGRPAPGRAAARRPQPASAPSATARPLAASNPAAPAPRPAGDRMGAQVQRDLPHAVDQAVASHLGAFSGQLTGVPQEPTAPRGADSLAASMLAELQTPAGVQKAIIMQEVLQRPLALRRR